MSELYEIINAFEQRTPLVTKHKPVNIPKIPS